eukprot:295713_1
MSLDRELYFAGSNYNISESIFKQNVKQLMFAMIDNPLFRSEWRFLDYKIHHENVRTKFIQQKTSIIKLWHNVFARWCNCNTFDFTRPNSIFLFQGTITLICFTCEHFHYHQIEQASILGECKMGHLNSIQCWNKPGAVFNNAIYSDEERFRSRQPLPSYYSLCKGCRTRTAVLLGQGILYIINKSKAESVKSTIHSIIFIHQIFKIYAFALERANIAKYLLSKTPQSLPNILYFISLSIDGMIAFFYYTTGKDNKIQIALLHNLFDCFSIFIKRLLQHSLKFNTLELNSCDADIQRNVFALPYKIQKFVTIILTDMKYNKTHTLRQKYLNNTYDIKDNIIIPLCVLTLVFESEFYPFHEKWKSIITQQLDLWSQIDIFLPGLFHKFSSEVKLRYSKRKWVKKCKSIPVCSQYLKMKDKTLRFDKVECQWRKCKKTKQDVMDKHMWKKCKKCQVARYCSRKCQKLDWKYGIHRAVCYDLSALEWD